MQKNIYQSCFPLLSRYPPSLLRLFLFIWEHVLLKCVHYSGVSLCMLPLPFWIQAGCQEACCCSDSHLHKWKIEHTTNHTPSMWLQCIQKALEPCRIPMNVAFVHFAKQSQKRIKTCRSLLQTPTGAFGTHLDIQSILLLAWIYTLGGEKKASACSNHHSFFSGYLHNKWT